MFSETFDDPKLSCAVQLVQSQYKHYGLYTRG